MLLVIVVERGWGVDDGSLSSSDFDLDALLSLLFAMPPPPLVMILGAEIIIGEGSNCKRRFWISVLRDSNCS